MEYYKQQVLSEKPACLLAALVFSTEAAATESALEKNAFYLK
jgi:hypothetical protein